MKVYDKIEQASLDWLRLRIGKVTASEFDNLVTMDFTPRKGDTPETYLCTKVAEAWRGEPLPGFGSFSTDQGSILEEEIIPWYNLEFDTEIQRVGFIEGDDGRCGCSPDGLLGDDGGIELKAPAAHTHVKYLKRGAVPNDYIAQVHFSMFVTGRKWWKFVSYRRKFPALVLTIDRDESICARIASVLSRFYIDYDKLIELLKQYSA